MVLDQLSRTAAAPWCAIFIREPEHFSLLNASFAAPNVRLNCVAPGLMQTPLKNRFTEAPTSPIAWDSLRPFGCSSDPEDVGAAIACLLDPVNSRVSGQVISTDGSLASLRGEARA